MRTITSSLVVVAAALTACAPAERLGEACPPQNVVVKHRPGSISISRRHETVYSCPGGRITVRIRPPVGRGGGHTAPGRANAAESWLRADDADGETIAMRVPSEQAAGTYKYRITVDGAGTLDPRVVIR
jgi:hypothetical protein